MLTFNYFFKRSNLRITGVQIYTVNTQKNEDHVIWSLNLEARKKKKRIIRGKNGNSDRGNTGDPECLHFK